jgi:polar amino acid transport system substrate-binding protein
MLLRALFILIIITTLSGCGKKDGSRHSMTIQEGILTAGVEINYPPMEYYDTDGATLLGFDIDLTRALAQKLGLQVKFVDTAWEGILSGLNTNRYDLALNVTVLPERQKRFNFTKPYIESSMTMAALKDSNIIINNPPDIAGQRVAFQGNTTAQYFTERLKDSGVKFTSFSYDKIINCFDDLRLRRVDLVVADNLVAYHYTEKENNPYKIIWQGPTDEYIAFCLKKGNDTLTNALNDALDELLADGTLAEISFRYFNRDLVSGINRN